MKFVVDAQMPPAAAEWLRSRGHDAVHLNEIGMKEAGDGSIWQMAVAEDLILITKDRDFVDRYASGQRPTPRIVWIRTGNLGRSEQVEHLSNNWVRILTRLNGSTPIIEVH